jgi:uncharacterized Fe-S cluster protein YjdI
MRHPDRIYSTEQIAVEWEPRLCIHSARCIAGNPQVFDPGRRPWVMPETAPAGEVAEIIARCPSGALHFRRLDGGAEEPVPDETVVMPLPNGPLLVRGNVVVEDSDGNVFRRNTRMALCRCGQSANRPFCDNTHRRIGFQG